MDSAAQTAGSNSSDKCFPPAADDGNERSVFGLVCRARSKASVRGMRRLKSGLYERTKGEAGNGECASAIGLKTTYILGWKPAGTREVGSDFELWLLVKDPVPQGGTSGAFSDFG